MKLKLDPWYKLYFVPENELEYSRFLGKHYFTEPAMDGTQGMTAKGRRWGVIPQILRYQKDWQNSSAIHRHLFLEFIFAVNGVAQFQEGNKLFEIKSGDLLLINHYCWHRIKSAKAGFTYFGLRFDVSFFDQILGQVQSPEQFSTFHYLRPFFKMNRGKVQRIQLKRRESDHFMVRFLQIIDTFLTKPFREILYRGDLRYLLESLIDRNEKTPTASITGQIQEYLSKSYLEKISTRELAKGIGVSRGVLSKKWNAIMGLSLPRYVLLLRLEKAKEFLRDTHLPTHRIAIESGFSSDSYFIKVFKKENGVSPGEFRERIISGK